MRTLTNYLWSLFAVGTICLLAAGCTDKEETRELDFSLSRSSVAFDVGGGVASLTVGTSDSWSASTDAAWLSLSQDGSTLYITAGANDQTSEIREAAVTVTTQNYGSETVQVRQAPAEAPTVSLNYGSSDPVIDSEGGSFTIEVRSNCDWTASLGEGIDGWELVCSAAAGTVTVKADANAGSRITGTVTVTAGSGSLTASEQVEVTQFSRDENPYYQFLGHWLVSAADCYYGAEWAGQEGVFTSCNVTDYDYSVGKLGLLDYDIEGLEIDRIEYWAEDGTFVLPLGFLGGIVYGGTYGTSYYAYLVALNPDVNGFSTSYTLTFTLNEDGSVASISGLDDEYPVLGWVGYSSYYYTYSTFSNLHYCKSPLSFIRSDGVEASSLSVPTSGFTVRTEEELPEGVPARLPKGFVGEISSVVMF